MSLNNIPLAILKETVCSKIFLSQNNLQSQNISTNLPLLKKSKSSIITKGHCNSRSSDSGKSSSCSPILLDCSFDSGIAGVLPDDKEMQLHKRIQQCQCILLALERDQEYFLTIRNRLSKITNRKPKASNENEFYCNVCCGEVDANDEKTYVKCCVCKKYICRNIKCSNWLPKTAEWECELCQTSKDSLAQTSSWVADQITFNQEKIISPPRARSEVYIPISEYNDSLIHFESVSQIGANSSTPTAEQKFKIREYVEEVVAKLLGGSLDTVTVNQLSKSEDYLNLFHKYHSKLSNILINLENFLNYNEGDLTDSKVKNIHNSTSQEAVVSAQTNGHDFSDISETRLRLMIQKIIAETMSLPPLTNGHAVSEIALDRSVRTLDKRPLSNGGFNQRHRTEHYFEPTIYQDLLATAVLNKIVDKQLKNIQNSSERQTEADDDDLNANLRDVSSDQNFNIEKLSTSSGSSVEPRSDCSYPEVEQAFNNNDDRSSEMLRNSDRDSVMSDYLANHMIPLPDLNAIATESEEDGDYTSVTSSALGDGTWEKNWLFKKKKSALSGSVTTSSIGMLVPDPKEDVRAQIGDKTADEVSDLSELGSDSDDSLNSLRSQLEPINDRLINKHLIGGENSKMILDELIERSSLISNSYDVEPIYTEACNENIIDAKNKTEAINDNVDQQIQLASEPKAGSEVLKDLNSNSIPGSIAEREYKKWYNAVEMPNNPYAPEALKRRISGSQERFIDLPNISPTKDLNPLNLLSEPTTGSDEDLKLENDYKRYSRDYYINSSLTTPQTSPARDLSTPAAKENREPTKPITSPTKADTKNDVYKAIPVQVIEITSSTTMETTSPTPTETQAYSMSISEDSDTIKLNEARNPEPEQKADIIKAEENVSGLAFTKSESTGNIIAPARGSTPVAFKFLQPKRKLLEPNQVLSIDEEEPKVASSQGEKAVIEEEVVRALPSVKALARAFLMTTNTTQPEKLWLRKARTLSQGGKKRAPSPKRSLDHVIMFERNRPEDDVTITSDLSSLETDSSSMGAEFTNTSNFETPASSSSIDPSTPDPVRPGVLKNNIAFFENLKNK